MPLLCSLAKSLRSLRHRSFQESLVSGVCLDFYAFMCGQAEKTTTAVEPPDPNRLEKDKADQVASGYTWNQLAGGFRVWILRTMLAPSSRYVANVCMYVCLFVCAYVHAAAYIHSCMQARQAANAFQPRPSRRDQQIDCTCRFSLPVVGGPLFF